MVVLLVVLAISRSSAGVGLRVTSRPAPDPEIRGGTGSYRLADRIGTASASSAHVPIQPATSYG